ncbi:MAG: hypothetical protein ACRDNK_11825 [Solirubrobacteraceae bacterium]
MTAIEHSTDRQFPAVTGELGDTDYVGRHRLAEPEPEFLDTFVEAAIEHTAELAALAVDVPLPTRVARWFVRNLTGARITVLVGTVGVLVGTGIGWVLR